MSLGNTHVKGALRYLLHHDIHGTTCWHGRCDSDNIRVLSSQFQQRMAEHILKAWGHISCVPDQSFSRFGIELTWCMPNGDILLGRCITVAFLGVQMEQLGTFHVLQLAHDAYQFLDIMTIEGPEIADVHTFKHVLLMRNGRL